MQYQLKLRQEYLANLCANWQAKICDIPFPFTEDPTTFWGPSAADIAAVSSMDQPTSLEEDEGMEEEVSEVMEEFLDDSENEADGELLDAFETFALSEAWHGDEEIYE